MGDSLTNFPNGVSSFGVPVVPGGFPTQGNVYFLDPYAGLDGNLGTDTRHAFKTAPIAYAALTANQNDLLYYLAGQSSISLTAALTWAKNYTALVGNGAPVEVSPRSRFFQAAAATGLSPLVDITATNARFENLLFFQGVDDATSLINVRVTGERCYFRGVHFAGGGHVTQSIDAGASLYLSGGGENLFENCTIGLDTVAAASGMSGLVLAATGGMTRTRFRNCAFRMYAGAADCQFVELLGNSGLDRDLIFENCIFINLSSTTMTQVFKVAAGFDPANKRVILLDCTKIGVTKWDDSDSGIIYGNMNAVTGADGSGGLVELIT